MINKKIAANTHKKINKKKSRAKNKKTKYRVSFYILSSLIKIRNLEATIFVYETNLMQAIITANIR